VGQRQRARPEQGTEVHHLGSLRQLLREKRQERVVLDAGLFEKVAPVLGMPRDEAGKGPKINV
jgi:hypothetical protein